jgi:predicted negative regulator of RcsB-dependent stress response
MENDPTVALYDFYGWLHTNRKRVLAGAIVVALISAIVGFVMWSNNQKEAGANQALFGNPAILGAPPGDPAAATALLAVSQNFAGTSAAAAADLLAARELFLGGKYPEAQQEFMNFVAAHPNHPLVPQASVAIAACMEAQGKIPDAVAQYKKVNSQYSSSPNIVIPVKLTLGRLSEADNKPDQAVGFYKELLSIQDPNDPWVVEASERLRLLVSKHPELNPFPAQTTAPAPSTMLTPSDADLQLSAPGASPAPAPKSGSNDVLTPPVLIPPPAAPNPPPTAPATNAAAPGNP